MEYYIDPSWIYWINVVTSLNTAIIIFMVFISLFAIFVLPFIAVEDLIEESTFKKLEITSSIIFIICIFGLIFIPSKETLIEMEVARLATKSNIELTVDSIKGIVDYIVETINKLK